MTEKLTTKNGYARLQSRLQKALSAYDAVCATNAHAAGDGDTSVWHDNFAYEHNQREMHKWARRITDLKNLLAEVRVVAPPPPTAAQLGHEITLRDKSENKEWKFEIAGYDDGDADRGRVSYTAPLLREIIGAEPGDEREVFLSGKQRTVVVSGIKTAGKEA